MARSAWAPSRSHMEQKRKNVKQNSAPALHLANSGIWPCSLALVSLGFLIYKIRIIIALISKVDKKSEIIYIKCLA